MRNYRFGENPRKATEIKKNDTEFFGIDQDGETKAIPAEILLTKENVGLGSVDNTADSEKPVSTPQLQALNVKLELTDLMEWLNQELKKTSDVKFNSLELVEALLLADLKLGDLQYSDIDVAAWHNSFFRGKIFENGLTQAHWDAVADGTFTDLYIGDQIKGASGTWYYIAAFNYYMGHNNEVTDNHLVLVPVDIIGGLKQMNTSNVTNTGYKGCKMFSYSNGNIVDSHNVIMSDFDTHMLAVPRYVSTSHSGSGWESGRYDDLMNEIMVYGSVVNGGASQPDYGLRNIGAEKTQLPLFRLRPDLIKLSSSWWLRDIASTTDFAGVSSTGLATLYGASNVRSVRSAFCVKG